LVLGALLLLRPTMLLLARAILLHLAHRSHWHLVRRTLLLLMTLIALLLPVSRMALLLLLLLLWLGGFGWVLADAAHLHIYAGQPWLRFAKDVVERWPRGFGPIWRNLLWLCTTSLF
jgi:hypothetical protein